MSEIVKMCNEKWKEFCLIMPAVAVGNVGQLTIDLLLSTLNVNHVGYLHHPSVLPMVGSDPFNLNSMRLITSWEVYECTEKKLVIVQQRSPVAPGKRKSYIEFLTEWFLKQNFKSIVLLSSSFSQFFTAEELQSVPMHYLCTSKAKPLSEDYFTQLGWKEFNLGTKADPTEQMSIPGAGVTKFLFGACEQKNISLVVLILVCSEGNNYPEALQMAETLNTWLKVIQDNKSDAKWKIPASWCLPFGSDPPMSIY